MMLKRYQCSAPPASQESKEEVLPKKEEDGIRSQTHECWD